MIAPSRSFSAVTTACSVSRPVLEIIRAYIPVRSPQARLVGGLLDGSWTEVQPLRLVPRAQVKFLGLIIRIEVAPTAFPVAISDAKDNGFGTYAMGVVPNCIAN